MKILHESHQEAVQVTGCKSIRILTAKDNMGFSVNKTLIPKGEPHRWHYHHHREACYCIEGTGQLINLHTNKAHMITPGTIYALNKGDNHTFQAITDVVLISIFNPPLQGDEAHDKNGSYPASQYKKDLINSIIRICNQSKCDYDAYDKLNDLL